MALDHYTDEAEFNNYVQMQERTAKFDAKDDELGCTAKRRKLEDIENQSMVEKDSE